MEKLGLVLILAGFLQSYGFADERKWGDKRDDDHYGVVIPESSPLVAVVATGVVIYLIKRRKG